METYRALKHLGFVTNLHKVTSNDAIAPGTAFCILVLPNTSTDIGNGFLKVQGVLAEQTDTVEVPVAFSAWSDAMFGAISANQFNLSQVEVYYTLINK